MVGPHNFDLADKICSNINELWIINTLSYICHLKISTSQTVLTTPKQKYMQSEMSKWWTQTLLIHLFQDQIIYSMYNAIHINFTALYLKWLFTYF